MLGLLEKCELAGVIIGAHQVPHSLLPPHADKNRLDGGSVVPPMKNEAA